tara:strand:+ start:1109 stop:1366 length:258 start_codon:yes stop_codon:yes gene_type:complete
MKLVILLFLLLGGCNVLGAGSLMHSVFTGNTVGIVSGGAGIAIEENTGKSPLEHVIAEITPKKIKTEPDGIIWSYEHFSNVLNEE